MNAEIPIKAELSSVYSEVYFRVHGSFRDQRWYAVANAAGDGTGPVRERYLTDPLGVPDSAQWQTEVCRPLAWRVPPGRSEKSLAREMNYVSAVLLWFGAGWA